MKFFTMTILFAAQVFSTSALAHDEGHGPKLGDQPKFGGKVTAVIDKKEVDKGTKATLLFKGELTKNNSNVVRVYLYDTAMNPIKIGGFEKAEGELQFNDKKAKKWVSRTFTLAKQKDGSYEGKLPVQPRRPFNVDATLINNDMKLFMAFDGLN